MNNTATRRSATSAQPHVTQTFPMRWGDMDALGHLNNTVYFRFTEEARVSWLHALGWRMPTSSVGEGFILASTSCQFKIPLVYPCDVQVETELVRLGGSSMIVRHRLARADQPDATAAEIEAVLVWCHYEAGKSRPLPADLRALLMEMLPA